MKNIKIQRICELQSENRKKCVSRVKNRVCAKLTNFLARSCPFPTCGSWNLFFNLTKSGSNPIFLLLLVVLLPANPIASQSFPPSPDWIIHYSIWLFSAGHRMFIDDVNGRHRISRHNIRLSGTNTVRAQYFLHTLSHGARVPCLWALMLTSPPRYTRLCYAHSHATLLVTSAITLCRFLSGNHVTCSARRALVPHWPLG